MSEPEDPNGPPSQWPPNGEPDGLAAGDGEGRLPRQPLRREGRRPPVTPEAAREIEAFLTRPTDEEGTRPAPLAEPSPQMRSRAAMRRAERNVLLLFLLSVAGTLLFLVSYATGSLHTASYGRGENLLLGTGLTLALFGLGAGMVVWAKRLLPQMHTVQEREVMHSPEEEELETERLFLSGAEEMGIPRRKAIRRAALAALGLFPLAFIFPLRDLGPLPQDRLFHTPWRRGKRLIDLDSLQPVKLGDLPVGGILTVMPEGATDPVLNSLAPVMLIHLPPGVNHPLRGRSDWAVDGLVAYSKICTHAGCPVSLFEQQDHFLLCPCHQSTFDVPHACRVIFGPATRALPQLPIYVDGAGYLRARRGFDQPVGPTFWERG